MKTAAAKLAPAYRPATIAALVRHWIERGETPANVEEALCGKLEETYLEILPEPVSHDH